MTQSEMIAVSCAALRTMCPIIPGKTQGYSASQNCKSDMEVLGNKFKNFYEVIGLRGLLYLLRLKMN